MRKLVWLGCLSYLVIGMAHVVAGAVLEPLLGHYGLSYQDGGQWIMNQFLGFLGGVLAAPYITRYIGRRNTLLTALGCLTAAEAVYSLLPPWELMLGFAPIAGFGFGLTEAVIGAIIIEFVVNGKAEAMTRLETFFGLGALLMPAAAALLISQGIWQMAFPLVTAVSGITTLLWLTMSFGKTDDLLAYSPAERMKKPEERGKYTRASIPLLVIGSLFFAIYVGMEMSFSNFLPSIMKDRTGMDDAWAAASLSVFWGMMVVGRLVAGRIADWSGFLRFLCVSTAGGTGFMVLLAMTGHATAGLIWVALGGLLWSGVFAIGLLYINERIPGMTERTTSLLIAAGGLGGAALPRLTGWVMDGYGSQMVLWMLVAACVVMLLMLVLVGLTAPREKRLEA